MKLIISSILQTSRDASVTTSEVSERNLVTPAARMKGRDLSMATFNATR